MFVRTFAISALVISAAVALATAAARADNSIVELRFENHRFSPANITVSAGAPLTVRVMNASHETIEFESFKLNREKAVEPGESIAGRLPALSAGSYDFYDDFHQDVPQGSITAK